MNNQPTRAGDNRPITPRRVDLHVHTVASSVAGEAALNAIGCPECYSSAEQVYTQATLRGMDFVTITDHDTIAGAVTLAGRANTIIGEEVTTHFPDDKCCFHLLVYGIDRAQHDALQNLKHDVYKIADYVARERIAHAVAHPLYRQNDRLTRWHLERLLLLFKGFEVLNGAHSALHRESMEPVLNNLTRQSIYELSEKHNILPKWPEPWFKARTGGSDDHGLLNIGRTYTELPADVKTVDEVLECLRIGACQPGGEAGSSIKLAHQFFSVGAKHFGRKLAPKGSGGGLTGAMIAALVGETSNVPAAKIVAGRVKDKLKAAARRVLPSRKNKRKTTSGAGLLSAVFARSVAGHLNEYPELTRMLRQGIPPLAAHEDVFKLVGQVNRDIASGIFDNALDQLQRGSLLGLFDAVGQVAANQFFMWPYYFALFHQNKERPHMAELARERRVRTDATLRVGLFTDTLDEINGVARFIRDMGEQARARDYSLTIHTSVDVTRFDVPGRVNFKPLLSRPMPFYDTINLNLPPLLEVLEHADRMQYDVIHCSTPGPMGMAGWLAGKMLRVPVVGTYHTDFPSYVEHLTHDHRMTEAAVWYMKWFYGQTRAVFSRSNTYKPVLRGLGVPDSAVRNIIPGINTSKFNPTHRDESVWERIGVKQKHTLFYAGRISVEKNLPLLVDAFKCICSKRNDIALVIAGEGPYEPAMRDALRDSPAYFLGVQNDAGLAPLYASADVFVFPSRTDTLGQVVMEAQASGLPAIVSDEGGPKEIVADDLSGLVRPAISAELWATEIIALLDDSERRQRYSRIAVTRSARYSMSATFEAFWGEHLSVAEPGKNEAMCTQDDTSKTQAPAAQGVALEPSHV